MDCAINAKVAMSENMHDEKMEIVEEIFGIR
jgi:hypothetical protein